MGWLGNRPVRKRGSLAQGAGRLRQLLTYRSHQLSVKRVRIERFSRGARRNSIAILNCIRRTGVSLVAV